MAHQHVEGNGRPIHFDLSRQKPTKTTDIGHKGTLLSADPLGRILQLSIFHPQHGIIVASPYEQFDGSRFRDPDYVRQYRTRMLDSIQNGLPGFGLRFDGGVRDVSIDLQTSGQALFCYDLSKDVTVSTTLQVQNDGQLVQTSTISSQAEYESSVRYTLDLGISVNRASYGQLTEGGPIPMPKSENKLVLLSSGTTCAILNRYLDAQIQTRLEVDGAIVEHDRDIHPCSVKGNPLAVSRSGTLRLLPNSSRKICARYRLLPTATAYDTFHGMQLSTKTTSTSINWNHEDSDAMFMLRRNFEYILGNCAIPVTDRAVALITDHVALPLGWNRDNYWQVRFLLDMYLNVGDFTGKDIARDYRITIKRTVMGHIHWVFHLAQRPNKFWHRSYLVTGRPKDGPVFQLDQQCYPLLELCDLLDVFPDEAMFVQDILDESTVSEILEVVDSKRDPTTGLYNTEETPGDDAVEFPFHFSSQILLWYTLSRIYQVTKRLDKSRSFQCSSLSKKAEDLRKSTIKHFLSQRPQNPKPIFAYLVDGKGHKTFYHDANDIPTLFAVEWGFLTAISEIEAWRNTMNFAFSEDNKGGYYADGEFGGLGSVHTQDPWPLGYLQEFLFASMTRNTSAEHGAWRKIKAAMQWDGLFSEAVGTQTAQCTSKAWFSWPGSMIGSALLRPELIQRYLLPSKTPLLDHLSARSRQAHLSSVKHRDSDLPVSDSPIIIPQPREQLTILV